MRKVAPPGHNARSTFELCVSSVKDEVLRDRLLSVAGRVEEAETVYGSHGNAATFHQISPESIINNCVTSEEMIKVYTGQLSRAGSPSRYIYDAIRIAAKICPLCGVRDVKTLDHYLPKSVHPVYSVTPLNLIPSCTDCNKAKSNKHPTSDINQTLHPYYDDVSDEAWLKATVIRGAAPVIRFEAAPPSGWSELKQKRVIVHFRIFELGELYSINAAQELGEIEYGLLGLSPVDVKRQTRDMAESCLASDLNSWRGAFYRALAESEWFCTEGYLCISDRFPHRLPETQ